MLCSAVAADSCVRDGFVFCVLAVLTYAYAEPSLKMALALCQAFCM
jgi:hypothetical protein